MMTIFSKTWRVSTNKFIEIEIIYKDDNTNPLSLWWEWTRETDHAGIKLWNNIFGLNMDFSFYDHRHWDNFLKTWVSCNPTVCPLEENEIEEPEEKDEEDDE